MTHVTELALAAALVGALGVGAVVMTPAPKPPPQTTIALERTATQSRRVPPARQQSDAERIAALQRNIRAIKTEQRELARTIRTLARERSER